MSDGHAYLNDETFKGLVVHFLKVFSVEENNWVLASTKVKGVIVEGTGKNKKLAFQDLKNNLR